MKIPVGTAEIKQFNAIEEKYLAKMKEASQQISELVKSLTTIKILRGKMRQEQFEGILGSQPKLPEEFFRNQNDLLASLSTQKAMYSMQAKRIKGYRASRDMILEAKLAKEAGDDENKAKEN